MLRRLAFFAAIACAATASAKPHHRQLPVTSNLTGPGYDPDMAYLAMLLSGAAYSSDPQSCLRKQSDTSNFLVTGSAQAPCDWAEDSCFGFVGVSSAQRLSAACAVLV